MRDSYEKFFESFGLNHKDLIDYGVNEDTIYPDKNEIKDEWNRLKQDILLGENPVYIRKYGRSAGSELYVKLYSILFPKCKIELDPTNNSRPRKTLEKSTGYFKTGVRNNIQNYQVSHVKGHTKNPLLFTAPWNIVWVPKIFDPFTGHESHGDMSTAYKTAFHNCWSNKYLSFIREYNDLILEHCSEQKLKSALAKVKESAGLDEKLFTRFEKSVFEELSQIII